MEEPKRFPYPPHSWPYPGSTLRACVIPAVKDEARNLDGAMDSSTASSSLWPLLRGPLQVARSGKNNDLFPSISKVVFRRVFSGSCVGWLSLCLAVGASRRLPRFGSSCATATPPAMRRRALNRSSLSQSPGKIVFLPATWLSFLRLL